MPKFKHNDREYFIIKFVFVNFKNTLQQLICA